jgi:serine/threonine protein kinase
MVWTVGQRIDSGNYTIGQIFSQGEKEILYHAVDLTGKPVLIQTLIEGSEELKEQFWQGSSRLALCRHPHLIEIEKVFWEGSQPGLILESWKGQNLRRHILENSPLDPGLAITYIRQIGSGLALLHERGILHSNINPETLVLCQKRSQVILTRLNLIPFLPSRQSGCYSPPEHTQARPQLGSYSDVYALAATLYYLVTDEDPEPAQRRLKGSKLIDPGEHNLNLSPRVRNAILQGMTLKIQDRPQTILEWLSLLT